MSKCDKNSSSFNIIIDYHDDIYKISLEEKINDRYVFLAEKNFNLFLCMPKIEECLEKYYNMKVKDYIFNKGKNNEIYPYMLQEKSQDYFMINITILNSLKKCYMKKFQKEK